MTLLNNPKMNFIRMVTGRTKSFWMEHISEKKTVLYILKVLLRHIENTIERNIHALMLQ